MWLLCGTEVKKACEVFTEFLCEGAEISAPQKVSVHGVCAGGRSLCVMSSGAAFFSRSRAQLHHGRNSTKKC